MPGDPNECRVRAKQCWTLAAETKNAALRETLADLAQRWMALATDLEATRRLLEVWGEPGRSHGPDGT
jgi:hypothetical protein